MLTVGGEYENALGFPKDRYVRIVCDKDYLARALNCLQRPDDRFIHKGVVEIIFRLIDQQRALALGQQDRQDRGASLSGRQVRGLFKVSPSRSSMQGRSFKATVSIV